MYSHNRLIAWRSLKTTRWSNNSRWQLSIQRSTIPFCQGLRYDVRTDWMLKDFTVATPGALKIESRSKNRRFVAES